MTTRDEYNEAEWEKFQADKPGSIPPVDLKCSTLNCSGTISDKGAGTTVVREDGLPQKRVECDTCNFGANNRGWRIANHS